MPTSRPFRLIAGYCIILGSFLLWDIPTSLVIQKLRKADVVIHHVAMAIVAYVYGKRIPVHYVLYYFGVSELSSIPLLFYDQWTQSCNTLKEIGDAEGDERIQRFAKQRDFFQIVAAVAFTLVRAVSFTKVSVCNFLPDGWAALPTASKVGMAGVLKFSMTACVGFTALQLYWFSTIVRMACSGERENITQATL